MRNRKLGRNISEFSEKLFATHSISNDDARALETIFSFFAQENPFLKEVENFTRQLKLSKSEIDEVLKSILSDFDPNQEITQYGAKKRKSLINSRKWYKRGQKITKINQPSQEQGSDLGQPGPAPIPGSDETGEESEDEITLRPVSVNLSRLQKTTIEKFRKS